MADQAQRPLTLGEYRVGITFNPGNNATVDKIKRMAADLIDLMDQARRTMGHNDVRGEIGRVANLAMDAFETGAMHAVKTVTKTPFYDPNGIVAGSATGQSNGGSASVSPSSNKFDLSPMDGVRMYDKDTVYYGPQPCQTCDKDGKKGTLIVKAGNGAPDSLQFNYPEVVAREVKTEGFFPYPNTHSELPWTRHVHLA